jgi:caa(3)-type oxidase subunit IV
MTSDGAKPSYVGIWVWLVALLGVSLLAGVLPGGRTIALLVIFGTAVAKALLVAANYMHLRWEPRFLYALALLPVLFVLGLLVALFPDFVLRH